MDNPVTTTSTDFGLDAGPVDFNTDTSPFNDDLRSKSMELENQATLFNPEEAPEELREKAGQFNAGFTQGMQKLSTVRKEYEERLSNLSGKEDLADKMEQLLEDPRFHFFLQNADDIEGVMQGHTQQAQNTNTQGVSGMDQNNNEDLLEWDVGRLRQEIAETAAHAAKEAASSVLNEQVLPTLQSLSSVVTEQHQARESNLLDKLKVFSDFDDRKTDVVAFKKSNPASTWLQSYKAVGGTGQTYDQASNDNINSSPTVGGFNQPTLSGPKLTSRKEYVNWAAEKAKELGIRING